MAHTERHPHARLTEPRTFPSFSIPVEKLVTLRGTCMLYQGRKGAPTKRSVENPQPVEEHFAATGWLVIKTVSLPASSGVARGRAVYQGWLLR